MLGQWRLKVNEPGEDLYAYISVQHPDFGNNYFVATLKAKRVEISSTTPDDLEAFFWLIPHKGSIISYWNVSHCFFSFFYIFFHLYNYCNFPLYWFTCDYFQLSKWKSLHLWYDAFVKGLKLWWKNAHFYEHPRKENPAYREEALKSNEKKTHLCPAFGGDNIGAANDDVVQREGTIDRCFVWKDAPWPWSYLIAPKSSSRSEIAAY